MTTVIKLIRPQDVIAHSTIRCPLGHDIPVAKGFCFHGMSTATVLEFGPCECCPIDFGPWGEWRSILWLFDYHRINIESARLCCCEYCTGESCPFEGDCDNPEVDYAIENAQEDFDAVGWSL